MREFRNLPCKLIKSFSDLVILRATNFFGLSNLMVQTLGIRTSLEEELRQVLGVTICCCPSVLLRIKSLLLLCSTISFCRSRVASRNWRRMAAYGEDAGMLPASNAYARLPCAGGETHNRLNQPRQHGTTAPTNGTCCFCKAGNTSGTSPKWRASTPKSTWEHATVG